MYAARGLSDDVVGGAARGVEVDRTRVMEALEPQVRLMVAARLSPSPAQLDAVDDIAQQVMVAVVECLPELENRTVAGLRSLVSVVAARRVADYLRGRERANLGGRPVASLETTVADMSRSGPLWQFLSAGGPTPLSAVGNTDLVLSVLRELGRLKREYRDIITLAFFDQLATREIAERLGVSRRAASMTLLRAINTLRSRLVEAGSRGTANAESD